MSPRTYRFGFHPHVEFAEVQATLTLAMIGCEALHGDAAVRMDANYHTSPDQRCIVIDGSTRVGSDLVRLFSHYIHAEFGVAAYEIARIGKHVEVVRERSAA